jgi:molybdate transport system ATP-binding protein
MTLSVDVRLDRPGLDLRAAFDARPGETLALLGPNGAGKSTIVSLVAGLVAPADGRVALAGRTLDDSAGGIHVPPEERGVGAVFQQLLLFPHMTALENVAFPLRAASVARAAALARASERLAALAVDHRSGSRPGELSGGEAQRVALARALVMDPDVLLLDEPLSALDVGAKRRIGALVERTLRAFAGVRILVTHDPVEALTVADRIVILEGGAVTQIGSPEDLRRAPRTRYAADIVGVNLFTGRLEPIPDGAGRIETPRGPVFVGWPPSLRRRAVEDALGVLRPSDVAIHVDRPSGSPRNVLHGLVESIAIDGQRARIVASTDPPVAAEVTLGSVARLGLATGSQVWISFKAVEVRVVVP